MYLRLIVMAFAALLMSSCSSKPDVDDVEKDLRNKISQESDKRIELVSIEKTNSVDQEFMGQEIRTIEFKAKIKILKDCYMYVNKSGTGPYFLNFKTYSEEPEFVPSLQMQIVRCDKGVQVDYVGSSSFSNSENGWIPND